MSEGQYKQLHAPWALVFYWSSIWDILGIESRTLNIYDIYQVFSQPLDERVEQYVH